MFVTSHNLGGFEEGHQPGRQVRPKKVLGGSRLLTPVGSLLIGSACKSLILSLPELLPLSLEDL